MIKRVTSIVISVHLLFIMLLLFTPPRSITPKVRHVKVNTVRPMAVVKPSTRPMTQPRPAPKTAPSKPPSTAKKTPPKKEAIPTSKEKIPSSKISSSSTTQKKTAPSKKPAVVEKGKPIKKKELPKKEPIWEEIDQALAKIETKRYPKEKLSLDIPQLLTFLDETTQPSNVEGAQDLGTESLIMGFLHDSLHLPEIGEVKIQLTVEKDGTVSKVVVISAESRKNKLYLQETLPHLRLPVLLDQKKTWTLTFYNEI